MTKQALIIGGSSGLGLELGLLLTSNHEVWITGRHDPRRPELHYAELDLSMPKVLASDLDQLLVRLPSLDLVVYSAGFYQQARLDELSDADIDQMLNVGLRAPAMLIQRLLKKQGSLGSLVVITSTSQWLPRRFEPVYTAVKAGIAMLANSLAEDGRISKVLVAGPSGMNTPIWRHHPREDADQLLDPRWVAKQILRTLRGNFRFKTVRILREPNRVEEVESR